MFTLCITFLMATIFRRFRLCDDLRQHFLKYGEMSVATMLPCHMPVYYAQEIATSALFDLCRASQMAANAVTPFREEEGDS